MLQFQAGAEGEFKHMQHEATEGEGADDLEDEAWVDRGSSGRRGSNGRDGVLHGVGKPKLEGEESCGLVYVGTGRDGECSLRVQRCECRGM